MAVWLQHIVPRDGGMGRAGSHRAVETMVKNWILLLNVTGKL